MTSEYTCPYCSGILATTAAAGEVVACPWCEQVVQLPHDTDGSLPDGSPATDDWPEREAEASRLLETDAPPVVGLPGPGIAPPPLSPLGPPVNPLEPPVLPPQMPPNVNRPGDWEIVPPGPGSIPTAPVTPHVPTAPVRPRKPTAGPDSAAPARPRTRPESSQPVPSDTLPNATVPHGAMSNVAMPNVAVPSDAVSRDAVPSVGAPRDASSMPGQRREAGHNVRSDFDLEAELPPAAGEPSWSDSPPAVNSIWPTESGADWPTGAVRTQEIAAGDPARTFPPSGASLGSGQAVARDLAESPRRRPADRHRWRNLVLWTLALVALVVALIVLLRTGPL